MIRRLRRWMDRRRLARNTHPTGVRQVDIPPAQEARRYRNMIEHEIVLTLLQQFRYDLAHASVNATLDVSELSPAFVDALEGMLSNLGYEIQRGYNGDRDVIRLIVDW